MGNAGLAQPRDSLRTDITQARLGSASQGIVPGEPFWAALLLDLKPGWHTYTDPPGDAGLPTEMEWTLPEGFRAGPIHWPRAAAFKEGTLTTYGYSDTVTLPVRITPLASLETGAEVTLTARAIWLVCKEICIPEEARLALTLPVVAHAPASADAPRIWQAVESADGRDLPTPSPTPSAPLTLLAALSFALLGGLILNLMPCVFPVLSLKCLAVARQGGISRAQARTEGLAYTAGVLLCFGAIAGLLIALQRSGAALGWGFQMQSPVFVAALTLLLFAIGLNLSGAFTLPVLLGTLGQSLTHEPTPRGSFFTGMLATLVATPCTAPFMASALGFALTQPPLNALLVFLALGLGLALPFLAVSFFPALLSRLPKPGAWMERFREFLAFPMYLSAIWLVWVLTQQAGAYAVAAVLLAMVFLIFALWLVHAPRAQSRARRASALLLIAVSAILALQYIAQLPASEMNSSALQGEGEPFNEARLEVLRAQGTPVFVDVTAAWCLTCRVNHHTTLSRDVVRQAFAERRVTLMVADWTRRDEAITRYLASFERSGVPLYVYYPPHGIPVILSQVLTPGAVLDALNAAPR